ncbi:MAG: glycine oxidase ThiO [Actinomycetota bacterium]|nr:glycine oxidase ThiO [Actinomycetota bacterium]
MRRTFDVAVVGAGVVGTGVAWRCARRGLSVIVIDESPGRGSSWAAAGLLAPITEAHYGEEVLLQLNVASSEMYPAFLEELAVHSDTDVHYARCGTLLVARDGDENAALDDVFAYQQRLGLKARRVRGSECRAIEPALAPGTRGGILVESDHQLDNRALVRALGEACRKTGATMETAVVTEVEVTGDRASGVLLATGESIIAGSVVIAAGSRSGTLGGVPASEFPLRPVKGQLVHLRAPEGTRLVTHNVRGFDCYVLDRGDGRVVLGGTVEERGYDDRVTFAAVHDLLRDGYELLPGLYDYEFVETAVGFRPGTPDNAPILGPTSIEGLVAATGHFRNGFLLAPITAIALERLLVDGLTDERIAPFTPTRFIREAVHS